MQLFIKVLKYLKFWFNAHSKKGFGIHSPFIFKLVTEIIHDFTPFYCYSDIEAERIKLLNNHQKINITDLGAGSLINKGNIRKISNIAKYSLKSLKQGQLLFRLINHFQFKNILEIGTSLGITTSYLAKVDSKSKVVTLEGCPEISKIAQQTFNNLSIENTSLITGDFKETLPKALEKFSLLDFVFFDGNHTKEATLNYFYQCLPKINNTTLFVFDDIYLNPEMEEAWNEIKLNPNVTVTLDLFHLGLVFFRKELTNQHFKIRF